MPGRSPPLRVALTGGIASGKSSVAALFAERAVPVIDTDRIARELVEPGQPALEEIRRVFGADVLDDEGRLDRERMRTRVFADPAERRRLETILHPRILQIADRRSSGHSAPYVLVAVPLLVEAGLTGRFDRVLLVDCPPEQQIERLMARDRISRPEAERMLDAQAGRSERLALADDVIRNDGPEAALAAQVERLDGRYRTLAAGARNRP